MELEQLLDLEKANEELKSMSPNERVIWAYEKFGRDLVLSTSGGHTSAILPHLVKDAFTKANPKIDYPPLIIFIDTLYYEKSTHDMVQKIREMDYTIRVYNPLVSKDNIEECYPEWWNRDSEYFDLVVGIIKKEPLKRALSELKAKSWMSGAMRWETKERSNMQFVEYKDGLYRFHPICDWSAMQASVYIKEHSLPVNDSHFDITKGPDQKLECGIHTM